jgi:hypothetical protein
MDILDFLCLLSPFILARLQFSRFELIRRIVFKMSSPFDIVSLVFIVIRASSGSSSSGAPLRFRLERRLFQLLHRVKVPWYAQYLDNFPPIGIL